MSKTLARLHSSHESGRRIHCCSVSTLQVYERVVPHEIVDVVEILVVDDVVIAAVATKN